MDYLNISDLTGPEWRFLEPYCDDPALTWQVFSGRPMNALERRVTRPALGRYRACLAAVWAARGRKDSVLVSHLPNVSLAVAGFARRLAQRVPHVAFAFNYTQQPEGRRLALARDYFRDIHEFTVFSRHEVDLYADLFDLPRERFAFLPWAMEAPEVAQDVPLPFDQPYFSAIGGEGRDYAVLATAMRQLPEARLAIVARPASVAGIAFPDNVRVFTNLPAPLTWAIAKGSLGMAVPLLSDRTPNGHVTLVGAQHLGIPLVVTESLGVADYVDPSVATLVPAGQAEAMAVALSALITGPEAAAERAARGLSRAQDQSDLRVWVAYFRTLDQRLRG
ncbi:hypothetical protein [Arenibacterium sp. LLYu02]|uniref:hypothetical protein n=1 Tax=Arenibacterium sp. LLYu02 TaxID=3404132 RepID=UPI003B20DABE